MEKIGEENDGFYRLALLCIPYGEEGQNNSVGRYMEPLKYLWVE